MLYQHIALHCIVQIPCGESDCVEPGDPVVQHAGGRHPLPHRRGDTVAGAHLARVRLAGCEEPRVRLSEEVPAGEILSGAGERSSLAQSGTPTPASLEEKQELQ